MNITPEPPSPEPEYPQHTAPRHRKRQRLGGIAEVRMSPVEMLSKAERNIMYEIQKYGWGNIEMLQHIGGAYPDSTEAAEAEKRFEKYRKVYKFMLENGIDFPR